MSDQSVDPHADIQRLKRSTFIAMGFVALLWLIALAADYFELSVYRLGVYPRAWDSLWGVVTAPLVHGSYRHLFANTLPLIVLGTTALYGYPRSVRWVIPSVYLGSGVGVWLFARASYHIGASGLTHGLMFFVFFAGVLRRDALSLALAMAVFFLYGGMVWGVFPSQPGISFEYHFFGAFVGTALAVVFRHRDPKRPRRRYEWEDETEPDDLPPIDTSSPDDHQMR